MNEPIFTIRIDFGFGIESVEGVGLNIEESSKDLLKKFIFREGRNSSNKAPRFPGANPGLSHQFKRILWK